MRSKKIVAAAVIACCVASQAQLLEKPKKYEGSFVPVTKLESKDRMDPEVRKFVDAQKAKKSVRKQVVKSDILGRKGTNKSASVKDSVVYAVDEASTAKMKVLVGRVHQYTPTGMQGYRDDVRYDEKTKKVIYSINGKEMSKAEYEKKTAEWENKYEQKKPNRTAPVVKYLTAKQIEDEIASSDDVVIAALPEARSVASSSHYGENYYTADVMWGINGIKTEAFDNGYKGQNVGIHFPDVGCAKASYLNSSYYQELSCPNKNYAHATGVARILHSTAENAKLYGSDVKTATSANWLPSNPKSYSPQIMVGSNSYAFFTQWDSTKSHYVNTNDYTYYDYLMDDYIYNTHVTEFVAAGNYESDYMAGYYVTTPDFSPEFMQPMKIRHGTADAVLAETGDLLSIALPKGERISTVIVMPRWIEAPVKEGDPVGSAAFYCGDTLISETPLLAAEDVPRRRFSDTLRMLLGTLFR
jgi:hypothetical protein